MSNIQYNVFACRPCQGENADNEIVNTVQPKGEGKKPYTKAPRIQRLVTPQRLQHKRHRMALKRRQAEASHNAAVCVVYL